MSLLQKLEESTPTYAGLPCKVGTLIKGGKLNGRGLSVEEQAKLEEVLEVPYGTPGRLPNTTIAAALRSEGYDVGDTAINKHRRHACRCFGSSPKYSMVEAE